MENWLGRFMVEGMTNVLRKLGLLDYTELIVHNKARLHPEPAESLEAVLKELLFNSTSLDAEGWTFYTRGKQENTTIEGEEFVGVFKDPLYDDKHLLVCGPYSEQTQSDLDVIGRSLLDGWYQLSKMTVERHEALVLPLASVIPAALIGSLAPAPLAGPAVIGLSALFMYGSLFGQLKIYNRCTERYEKQLSDMTEQYTFGQDAETTLLDELEDRRNHPLLYFPKV